MRGKRYRSINPTYYPVAGLYCGTMSSWQPFLGGGGEWRYPTPYGYFQNWPRTNPVLRVYGECWDDVHKRATGNIYREGGPLFIRQSNLSVGNRYVTMISHLVDCGANPVRKYVGTQVMPPSSYIHVNDVTSRVERASNYGAQAWRMFSPDKPAANLAEFWVELRDLKQQFEPVKRTIKSLAGGFVNLQFGWAPFLRDIVDVLKAMDKINGILTHMQKYNGKWQKRKGIVEEEKENEITYQLGNCIQPVLTGEFYPPPSHPSTGKVSISMKSKAWFEASVKYYIPEIDKPSIWNSTKLLAKILGLDFTRPLLYWKLFPYSWLEDWCGNMSHIIRGMEILTNSELVAKYAYVMEERVLSAHQWQEQRYQCDGTLVMHTTYDLVSKERANVNPLGFGPLVLGLTPTRLAILAALGLQGSFGHF